MHIQKLKKKKPSNIKNEQFDNSVWLKIEIFTNIIGRYVRRPISAMQTSSKFFFQVKIGFVKI